MSDTVIAATMRVKQFNLDLMGIHYIRYRLRLIICTASCHHVRRMWSLRCSTITCKEPNSERCL